MLGPMGKLARIGVRAPAAGLACAWLGAYSPGKLRLVSSSWDPCCATRGNAVEFSRFTNGEPDPSEMMNVLVSSASNHRWKGKASSGP